MVPFIRITAFFLLRRIRDRLHISTQKLEICLKKSLLSHLWVFIVKLLSHVLLPQIMIIMMNTNFWIKYGDHYFTLQYLWYEMDRNYDKRKYDYLISDYYTIYRNQHFKFEQMDKWSSGTRTSHQRMIFKAAATMPKTYAGRKSGPNQNNPTDRRR